MVLVVWKLALKTAGINAHYQYFRMNEFRMKFELSSSYLFRMKSNNKFLLALYCTVFSFDFGRLYYYWYCTGIPLNCSSAQWAIVEPCQNKMNSQKQFSWMYRIGDMSHLYHWGHQYYKFKKLWFIVNLYAKNFLRILNVSLLKFCNTRGKSKTNVWWQFLEI